MQIEVMTLASSCRWLFGSVVVSLEGQRCRSLGDRVVQGGVLHSLPGASSTFRGFYLIRQLFSGSIRKVALSQEIDSLLEKEAVNLAPPSSGYYSCMFMVEKSSGA